MHPSSLYHIIYIFIFFHFTKVLTLSTPCKGTNFTRWSEDDWLERRFFINTKFVFNQQQYQHVIIHTRTNQWSLQLSDTNITHLSTIWTELHLYFNDYNNNHSSSLNHSMQGHIRNKCYPPIYSPITNDSNTNVPQLSQMDEHIANYFVTDGFFRTINYIHCRIDESRLDPLLHIEIDVYFVTNREFHSLLYIELSNATYELLVNNQARFYLHNHDTHFRYSFNISHIKYPTKSDASFAYMIKLYNTTIRQSSNSMTFKADMIIIVILNFCIFVSYYFNL